MKVAYSPIKEIRLDVSYSPKFNFDSNKVYNNIVPFYDVDDNPVTTVQKEPWFKEGTTLLTMTLNS